MKVARMDVLCVECKELKQAPVWLMKREGSTPETYVCQACRRLSPPKPFVLPGLGMVTEGENPEQAAKLAAERVTLELRTKSRRPLDRGQRPIDESPLFGGPAQASLFGPTGYEDQ